MARPQNTRKPRARNTSTSKPNHAFLKLTAAITAVVLSLTTALPSIAANTGATSTPTPTGGTPLSNTSNDVEANSGIGTSSKTGETADANAEEQRGLAVTTTADVQAAISECADIKNPDGLGAAHKNALDRAVKIAMTTMDMNNVFDIKKNQACFSALTDFPDLSVSIPSLSSIFTAMKNTLIKYANRKVCEVVNQVTSEMMGPINDVLGEFSQGGVIDLTGVLNTTIGDELYKIDPTLGTVMEGVDTGYTIDQNDVYDVIDGSTTVGDKTQEIIGGAIGGNDGSGNAKSGASVSQPSTVEQLSSISSNSNSAQESEGIAGMIGSIFGK